jgi:hypothetical protein
MRNPEDRKVVTHQARYFAGLPFGRTSDPRDDEPFSEAEFANLTTDADQIAAMARSLRATLVRDRPGSPPITTREAADIVELIQLLAESVALLVKRGDAVDR